MLKAVQSVAISPAARWSRGVAFLILAAVVIAFAFVFPTIEDEVSRITEAASWRSAAPNSYFWPIGNVALVLISPFSQGPLDLALLSVRLVNAALTLAALGLAIHRTGSLLALVVLAIAAPYLAIVVATASQQGLMIALITLLMIARLDNRRALFAVAAALLYLVNPATIVILPLAMALQLRRPDGWRFLGLALLGYMLTWPFIAFAYLDSGAFLPTISGNGAYNLVLGNNPHPQAARGIASDALLDRLLAPDAPPVSVLVGDYLKSNPGGFIANLARKAWLYWMPWDYFRSNIGAGFYALLFVYVGIAQVAIYGAFWLLRTRINARAKWFAIALALAAWLIYTL
ncbi:MAG TPA: hypothetical protein ENK80_00210, partial [Rhodobacterales bacterium]|nr:hypothetical protein [Rhodobacterales bacterium]